MAGIELKKSEAAEELDWLLVQEYKGSENQVTEALFKWFFFSRTTVQKRFLSKICQVRGKNASWKEFSLQEKGKKGTADASIVLGNNSRVLFEFKTKDNAVSSKQLKRHLKDAGWRPGGKKPKIPRLILVTPDFKTPIKLEKLPEEKRKAIVWIPWSMVLHFLYKDLRRGLHSDDKMLRDALLSFLKKDENLRRHLVVA